MSEKIRIELGDVQKTMLLPLWGRAIETQKPAPLLIDHTAVEIIKNIAYDYSEQLENLSGISQLGWIARSIHIDTVIQQFLKKHPTATIVNIGCGLDTTFDRIDNGRLSWYDVDLADAIALRRKFIHEQERRTFVASSFLEQDWLAQLNIHDTVLFIAAGVLYYFEERQIKEFLIHLAEVFPGAEMVFDASSPVGIRMANKMVITDSGLDEKSFLKWGLKHAKTLESWSGRIKIVQEYPMFRSLKHRIPFKHQIVAWVSDMFKIQYMVHIQFTK